MLARVTTQTSPVDALTDEVLDRVRTDILAAIRGQDGNRGVLLLLDRKAGKELSVSLWDGEEALRNSEQRAGQIKGDVASMTGGSGGQFERYEVLAIDLDASVISSGTNS